jgi:hypothetical protein
LLVCCHPIFIFGVRNHDLLAINFVFNLGGRSLLLASDIAFESCTGKGGENLSTPCRVIVFPKLL